MKFKGKTVFLVGCQRSGTTWLQLLLYQHPAVASSQETHMFSRYLGPLEARWKSEEERFTRRMVGLSATLLQAEFEDLMRQFAESVLAKIVSIKPNARVVVEKTPDHLQHWELILRLFPDAYFLHIIRDPRSVACSLRDAAHSWGSRWASANVIQAAKYWRNAVHTGRQIPRMTDRYKEVRYEDLLNHGPEELQAIFAWLELDVDPNFFKNALASCSLENLKDPSSQVSAPWALNTEPKRFFREGGTTGWHTALSKGDLRVIEYVAGDLLEDLRYSRTGLRPHGKPFRLILHESASKAFQHVDAVLRRLLWGVGQIIRDIE